MFLASIIFIALGFFLTVIYPDILWFNSFNFGHVWWQIFSTKLILFFVGFFLSFSWLWIHLKISSSIAGRTQLSGEPRFTTPFAGINQLLSDLVKRRSARQNVSHSFSHILGLIVVLIISVLVGLSLRAQWQEILLYFNHVSFSVSDPIFSKDVAFYIFILPFLNSVQGYFMAFSVLALGVSVWIYFSQNILLFIFSDHVENRGIKAHVFCLLALVCVAIALSCALGSYSILFSTEGVVFGAGFTDVNIRLYIYRILLGLFVFNALIYVVYAFRRGVFLPLFFSALTVVVAVLGNGFFTSLVQNYVVAPNEIAKESRYIEHNIQFTRLAYGLNKIQEYAFPVSNQLSISDIQNNETIFHNVRLWNREPLRQTFSQLQEIRPYYEFSNVDVDRYMINGELRQVMLSARELDITQIIPQAQTWINTHLVYTHGYGAVMSPVNQVTPEGLPHLFIKNFPTTSNVNIHVNRPQVYFGEKTDNYVITNTNEKEFDYPQGKDNEFTQYSGKGGVQLSSVFRRLAYAIYFSDMKLLISSQIHSDSRLLYDRNIREIVSKLAPFLHFDRDPYLVINDSGQLKWMMDAYTISNRFPYSEPFSSGLNYIRNSVKVVVDAYDGTVDFYLIDSNDPVAVSLSKAIPGFFKEFEDMPADLKNHIQYPKDLFEIQSLMYRVYHMDNVQVFYNKEDLWAIPRETYDASEQEMMPYHMIMKLPGEAKNNFVLMRPFSPANKDNMIAWMGAKSDLADYGELVVYKFPKEKTVYGPRQIEARIDQDTDISKDLTLWGQVGSRVIRGNLMVIPIENSIVFVEPIYLKATQSQMPELKRVIFSYNDQIVMENTLNNAIERVFSLRQNTLFDGVDSDESSLGSSSSSESLLDQLVQQFKEFKKAASEQKWLEFGQKLDKIQSLIDKLGTDNTKNK